MAKLFVTGLAGYLGSELAQLAQERGWTVTGTILERPAPRGVAAQSLDVRDEDAIRDAVAEAAPDAVVHTAYRRGGAGAETVNVDGALAVARAAEAACARLVHLSTDLVFGGTLGRPLREDDPPDPIMDYGRAKARAEEAVSAAAPGAALVRTSLIYGGHEPSDHERLALRAADGADVTFFTDELRCPVAAPDLAAAILELARSDLAGPLHVAGADGIDRLAFARLIAAANGRDPAAVRGGAGGPERPKDCRLDCSRALGVLRTPLRGASEVLTAPA